MAAERIRIRARFADQCPLFKSGEGMTLELPGVVNSRCHNVCAASIGHFLTMYESRKGKVDGREYVCSWGNCRATMEVTTGAEFAEVRPSAEAPQGMVPVPPPPPAPAAVPQRSSSNAIAAFMKAAAPKQQPPQPPPLPAAALAAPAAPAAPAATPGAAPGLGDLKTKARLLSIATKLKIAHMFVGLGQEELEKIAAAVKLISFAPGTILLKAGEPGERFFLLSSGKVDVLQVDKDGTEKNLSTLGANECVGEMSLLTGEKCSATVRATEPVQALVISRADFEGMLESTPQLNRHFNRILAERLRTTNQKLTDFIENGVLGKLGMFSLPELTQALSVSGRTGFLHLMRKDKRGVLTVRDGFVFNVKLPGAVKPEDAFLELMTWREGEFKFEQADISTLGLKPIDTMSLLMEGMRRQDELAKTAGPT